jgi:hypothetical protein
MTRDHTSRVWRLALGSLAALAAAIVGGCAGDGGGNVDYSVGVHYGSYWGPSPWYYGGPVYVGPPPGGPPPGGPPGAGGGRPPPGGGAGAPHPSHPIARPMPPPRPTPRAGGGGRRR